MSYYWHATNSAKTALGYSPARLYSMFSIAFHGPSMSALISNDGVAFLTVARETLLPPPPPPPPPAPPPNVPVLPPNSRVVAGPGAIGAPLARLKNDLVAGPGAMPPV